MAENFEHSKSITRFQLNLEVLLRKYNSTFDDNDVIDLGQLGIAEDNGTIRRGSSRPFGSSRLRYTKQKDEENLSRYGTDLSSSVVRDPSIWDIHVGDEDETLPSDPNQTREIYAPTLEDFYDDVLTHVDEDQEEPSDAETIFSFESDLESNDSSDDYSGIEDSEVGTANQHQGKEEPMKSRGPKIIDKSPGVLPDDNTTPSQKCQGWLQKIKKSDTPLSKSDAAEHGPCPGQRHSHPDDNTTPSQKCHGWLQKIKKPDTPLSKCNAAGHGHSSEASEGTRAGITDTTLPVDPSAAKLKSQGQDDTSKSVPIFEGSDSESSGEEDILTLSIERDKVIFKPAMNDTYIVKGDKLNFDLKTKFPQKTWHDDCSEKASRKSPTNKLDKNRNKQHFNDTISDNGLRKRLDSRQLVSIRENVDGESNLSFNPVFNSTRNDHHDLNIPPRKPTVSPKIKGKIRSQNVPSCNGFDNGTPLASSARSGGQPPVQVQSFPNNSTSPNVPHYTHRPPFHQREIARQNAVFTNARNPHASAPPKLKRPTIQSIMRMFPERNEDQTHTCTDSSRIKKGHDVDNCELGHPTSYTAFTHSQTQVKSGMEIERDVLTSPVPRYHTQTNGSRELFHTSMATSPNNGKPLGDRSFDNPTNIFHKSMTKDFYTEERHPSDVDLPSREAMKHQNSISTTRSLHAPAKRSSQNVTDRILIKDRDTDRNDVMRNKNPVFRTPLVMRPSLTQLNGQTTFVPHENSFLPIQSQKVEPDILPSPIPHHRKLDRRKILVNGYVDRVPTKQDINRKSLTQQCPSQIFANGCFDRVPSKQEINRKSLTQQYPSHLLANGCVGREPPKQDINRKTLTQHCPSHMLANGCVDREPPKQNINRKTLTQQCPSYTETQSTTTFPYQKISPSTSGYDSDEFPDYQQFNVREADLRNNIHRNARNPLASAPPVHQNARNPLASIPPVHQNARNTLARVPPVHQNARNPLASIPPVHQNARNPLASIPPVHQNARNPLASAPPVLQNARNPLASVPPVHRNARNPLASVPPVHQNARNPLASVPPKLASRNSVRHNTLNHAMEDIPRGMRAAAWRRQSHLSYPDYNPDTLSMLVSEIVTRRQQADCLYNPPPHEQLASLESHLPSVAIISQQHNRCETPLSIFKHLKNMMLNTPPGAQTSTEPPSTRRSCSKKNTTVNKIPAVVVLDGVSTTPREFDYITTVQEKSEHLQLTDGSPCKSRSRERVSRAASTPRRQTTNTDSTLNISAIHSKENFQRHQQDTSESIVDKKSLESLPLHNICDNYYVAHQRLKSKHCRRVDVSQDSCCIKDKGNIFKMKSKETHSDSHDEKLPDNSFDFKKLGKSQNTTTLKGGQRSSKRDDEVTLIALNASPLKRCRGCRKVPRLCACIYMLDSDNSDVLCKPLAGSDTDNMSDYQTIKSSRPNPFESRIKSIRSKNKPKGRARKSLSNAFCVVLSSDSDSPDKHAAPISQNSRLPFHQRKTAKQNVGFTNARNPLASAPPKLKNVAPISRDSQRSQSSVRKSSRRPEDDTEEPRYFTASKKRRLNLSPNHSANSSLMCEGPGKCQKSFCFSCIE